MTIQSFAREYVMTRRGMKRIGVMVLIMLPSQVLTLVILHLLNLASLKVLATCPGFMLAWYFYWADLRKEATERRETQKSKTAHERLSGASI